MKREPSLLKLIAAAAGFLVALVALVVLVLVTRDAGAPVEKRLEPGCLDFGSQKEAQRFFEREGVNELDADGNGVACELLAAAAKPVTLDNFVLTQVTATATPTSTATPAPTVQPTTTPGVAPSPTTGVLPRGGAQSAQMAVAGMSLVTTGMFGVTVYNARAYLAERRRRRDDEEYDLIGW